MNVCGVKYMIVNEIHLTVVRRVTRHLLSVNQSIDRLLSLDSLPNGGG